MQFRTLQNVREWRTSDYIECLICQQRLKRLTPNHLGTHGLTHDRYRALFGLPQTFSLVTAKSPRPAAAANRNTPFLSIEKEAA